MTLPELCECSESSEGTMPDSPTTLLVEEITSDSTEDSSVSSAKLGKALLSLLHQAACQGRATCTLTSCVTLLSERPDDVMLCVMPAPTTADDAAATIQRTLIRAVCREHAIRVLEVDCDVKLAKAVCGVEEEMKKKPKGVVDENCNPVEMKMKTTPSESPSQVLKTRSPCSEDADGLLISGCDNLAPVMGFPCVLVEFPQDPSPEDELVAEFCKKHLYGDLMEAYIELPD